MEKFDRKAIVAEIKKLILAEISPPNIYEFKKKCGYDLLSEFFPILRDIEMLSEQGMSDFVAGLFATVSDARDLNYCYGGCDCEPCQDQP